MSIPTLFSKSFGTVQSTILANDNNSTNFLNSPLFTDLAITQLRQIQSLPNNSFEDFLRFLERHSIQLKLDNKSSFDSIWNTYKTIYCEKNNLSHLEIISPERLDSEDLVNNIQILNEEIYFHRGNNERVKITEAKRFLVLNRNGEQLQELKSLGNQFLSPQLVKEILSICRFMHTCDFRTQTEEEIYASDAIKSVIENLPSSITNFKASLYIKLEMPDETLLLLTERCPHLQELCFHLAQCTPKGLNDFFKRISLTLTSLELKFEFLDSEVFTDVSFPHLTHIHLAGYDYHQRRGGYIPDQGIPGQVLACLPKRAPNLTNVKITSRNILSNEAFLTLIGGLSKLTILDMRCTPFSGHLSQKLNTLQELNIQGCRSLNVISFLKQCPQLKKLIAGWSCHIELKELEHIFFNMPHLIELDLEHTEISKESYEALIQKIEKASTFKSNLQSISLRQATFFTKEMDKRLKEAFAKHYLNAPFILIETDDIRYLER